MSPFSDPLDCEGRNDKGKVQETASSPQSTGRRAHWVYEKRSQLLFRETCKKWSHDGPKKQTITRSVSRADGAVPGAICGAAPGEHEVCRKRLYCLKPTLI